MLVYEHIFCCLCRLTIHFLGLQNILIPGYFMVISMLVDWSLSGFKRGGRLSAYHVRDAWTEPGMSRGGCFLCFAYDLALCMNMRDSMIILWIWLVILHVYCNV